VQSEVNRAGFFKFENGRGGIKHHVSPYCGIVLCYAVSLSELPENQRESEKEDGTMDAGLDGSMDTDE